MEGPGITSEYLPLSTTTEDATSSTSRCGSCGHLADPETSQLTDLETSQLLRSHSSGTHSSLSSIDAKSSRSTSSGTSNDVFVNSEPIITDVTNHMPGTPVTAEVMNHSSGTNNKSPAPSTGTKELRKQMSVDSANVLKLESRSYFPQKPGTGSQRSASTWSLYSGCRPAISPRENKVSTRRKQLAHSTCASIDENDTYMTPYQRKEQTIRDLRRELVESHEKLRERELEIQNMVCEKDVELSVLLASKNLEVHSLREQLRVQQEECVQLKEQQDKVKDERDDLKLKNKEMELDAKKSEERNKEMYLLMYEKGKRSADFERQDTLEELADNDPSAVSVLELLEKLKQTQDQLALLQSTTRRNQYEDAAILSPTTDSEATLRCVRDALYHYLCSTDHASRKLHLNVMLGLAGFTSVQRKNIDKAMAKSKKNKKSSK